MRVLTHGRGLYGLNSCQYQRRGNLSFLISLFRWGRGESVKVMGLPAAKYQKESQIHYRNASHAEIILDFCSRLLIIFFSMYIKTAFNLSRTVVGLFAHYHFLCLASYSFLDSFFILLEYIFSEVVCR